jgi:phenylacetic acid degradation operon negative regulatory protein
MGPKTEELLNILLWSAEILVNPSWRSLFESYEGWAYRNGLLIQLGRLEQRKLVTRKSKDRSDRIYRLSAQGRLHALGGRDPEARWGRAWDGRWRLVIFDIPSGQDAEREWLRRYLRGKDFGCLQNSVWITPDPMKEERRTLARGSVKVESLVLLEARACAGESDEEIISGAWNFARINERYSRYLKTLEARPAGGLKSEAAAKKFFRWMSEERAAWLEALTIDPLLPARLLPANYLGQTAWRRRLHAMGKTARQTAGENRKRQRPISS